MITCKLITFRLQTITIEIFLLIGHVIMLWVSVLLFMISTVFCRIAKCIFKSKASCHSHPSPSQRQSNIPFTQQENQTHHLQEMENQLPEGRGLNLFSVVIMYCWPGPVPKWKKKEKSLVISIYISNENVTLYIHKFSMPLSIKTLF